MTNFHPPQDEVTASARDCLRFVTQSAEKPIAVDLTVFYDGTQNQRKLHDLRANHKILRKGGIGNTIKNPFRGRPELITKLAPAFRELYLFQRAGSVRGALSSLRAWFCLFDSIDDKGISFDAPVPSVNRVEDIGEVHRQLALDMGMSWQSFGPFKRVVNLARMGLGLRPLQWPEPQRPEPKRALPEMAHVTALRHEFKHRWFATIDRWSRMDGLLRSKEQLSSDDEYARKNYLWLLNAMAHSSKGWPTFDELAHCGFHQFYGNSLHVKTMLDCRYPNRGDVLSAFHLCLSTTGWNPATLLELDATSSDALCTHPKDVNRYVMRAYKARSKLYQYSEGLWKSQSAPGVVIKTLIERTAPLRLQLQRELEITKAEFNSLRSEIISGEALDTMRLTVERLQEGTRSPWLYPDLDGKIGWLNEVTWGNSEGGRYLTKVLREGNERRPPDKQIPHFSPSDFRDAFAAYAYLYSGGMVYFVMRVLGHKRVKSTEAYVRNTFLNERSINVYRTFANGLWREIIVHKRLDPTVLAMVTRDGDVTDLQRERIAEYRQLRKSRLGIGCMDRFAPPKKVSPGFLANGRRMCSTHRCTLCVENAVIFEESLDGLAMRWAELIWLKKSIPIQMYYANSFQEELENTETALEAFDAIKVKELKAKWELMIFNGEHFPPQFELISEGTLE